MEREFLEKCLSRGMSLRQIGALVNRERSTISYHLKQHGLKPVNGTNAANKGGICEEVLEIMVDDGLSLTQMARQLDRSNSNVRYWLKKHGFWPLPEGRRRAEARRARELGLKRVQLECSRHGVTDFILEGCGYHRVRQVPDGGSVTMATAHQAAADRGGRGSVCPVRLRPVRRSYAVPPC